MAAIPEEPLAPLPPDGPAAPGALALALALPWLGVFVLLRHRCAWMALSSVVRARRYDGLFQSGSEPANAGSMPNRLCARACRSGP